MSLVVFLRFIPSHRPPAGIPSSPSAEFVDRIQRCAKGTIETLDAEHHRPRDWQVQLCHARVPCGSSREWLPDG
jgi:hypothetical protein